jgi:hypothetical protein
MSRTEPTNGELLQHVKEAWQGALPGSDPTLGFFDQGGTSIAAILLISQLEQRLGVVLPFAVLVLPGGAVDIVDWISSNGP